jgi:prepilin-type N-terminal cleavage/methylation domain-containing protein
MFAGSNNGIKSFTLVDPVSSTGYASRFAARLTGSTRVKTAFTLVELLIVIAILAVLAAAVVIVLNPAELLAQARDSQRITDLKTLKDAIDIFVVDNPSASLGTSQKVYVSLPDTSSTCANISLPTLPAGWTYNCVTTENLRNTDGTGWVPLNLGTIFGGTPIPYLPLDPQNDATLTKYYAYIPGGSYVLTSLMESEKQAKAALADGGMDPGRFEVGSDLALWTEASGLVGYWPFDGIGLISDGQTAGIQDISGNSNDGTAYNVNGVGMTFTTGKVGNAIQFDGIDDYVGTGKILLTGSLPFTMTGWVSVATSGSTKGFWGQNDYAEFGLSNSTTVNCWTSSGRTVSFQNPPTGTWHYHTVSWSASGLKLYMDGVEVAASSPGGTITNSAYNFNIGGGGIWAATGGYLNGSIDDVRVYDRALSAAEIRSLYNATK